MNWQKTMVTYAIALCLLGACGGLGDDDGSTAPVGLPSRACETNVDLLLARIDRLPERVDAATLGEVGDINSASANNLLLNECEPELTDRVDAAICTYLSTATAAQPEQQGLLDATAAAVCDLTGETVGPADPAPGGQSTTSATSETQEITCLDEDFFLSMMEDEDGTIDDIELSLLGVEGRRILSECGAPSDAFCTAVAAQLDLVDRNDEVLAASGCPGG